MARLLDTQAVHTRDRRLTARLHYARFPFHKTVEDFDFEFQPSIDPKLVADLATLRFVAENRPILFLGQPGCGKTIFGDSVIAAAILDRLMHNAVVFNIKGPSWRLREHHGLEIATTTNPRHPPTARQNPASRDAKSDDRQTRLPLIAHTLVIPCQYDQDITP